MDDSNKDIKHTSTKEDLTPPQPKLTTSIEINTPSILTTKGKHLQKTCHICSKIMRSDNLKRHLKTHNVAKSKFLMISCVIC